MSRQGQAKEATLSNIKAFWEKEATEWGDNPQVTIRDHYFRLLTIHTISKLIDGRHNAIDIGCGTGFSDIFYSQHVDKLTAVDYSSKMVHHANRLLSDASFFNDMFQKYYPGQKPALRNNITFDEGDILSMKYKDGTFDASITERVLINLPTTGLQDKAIHEVSRILGNNGLWIALEVTQQGHKRVDHFRTMFGLSLIEKYWHNLYVDEDHFQVLLHDCGFELKEIIRFEPYQFLTKIVHPYIVLPEEPKFLAGFNRAAYRIGMEYPTFNSIKIIGTPAFFKDKFRPLLLEYDPDKIPRYDNKIDEIIDRAGDFEGCSHQILFAARKK